MNKSPYTAATAATHIKSITNNLNQFLLLLQPLWVVNQHKYIFARSASNRCSLLVLASTLSDYPIKGWEYADVTVRLLEGLGVVNSKSDWLKQQSDRHLFYATGPAELILKASRQISLTLATNYG